MKHLFLGIGNYKAARGLWENREALGKYLAKLKELMLANPDSRITEDETTIAARIRAELFNSGLRGTDLIAALRERLLVEGMAE